MYGGGLHQPFWAFLFLSSFGTHRPNQKICDYVIPPACTVFTFFFSRRKRRRFVFAETRGGERESIVCVCVCVWFCCRFLHLSTREKSLRQKKGLLSRTHFPSRFRSPWFFSAATTPSVTFIFFFLPLLLLGRLPDFHLHYLCFFFCFFSLLLGCSGIRWGKKTRLKMDGYN